MRRCALHRRHGMGAFDRFARPPTVSLGRGGGEYTSTNSSSRHARAMRLRRHQVEQARTETRLNETASSSSERQPRLPLKPLCKAHQSLSGSHSCVGRTRSIIPAGDDTALCGRLFLLLRRPVPTSCSEQPKFATHLLRIAVQRADARGLLDGSIWPKSGCASIV